MNKTPIDTPNKLLKAAGRVLGVLGVILISLAIFSNSHRIEQFKTLGYLGAFLVMLLGNATIILPAPGLTIVFALGSAFNPVLVGLAAGAGAALGELTGYLAGASGSIVFESHPIYLRLERIMKEYGNLALFVLAVIPNPFFDIAGLIAGVLRFYWWRFLLISWTGKTLQGIMVAFAGAASAQWLLKWL